MRESAEIFFLKLVSDILCFIYLCSVESVEWFLVEIKPLLDTSKASREHLYAVISVMKCEYLFVLFVWRLSMWSSRGQVSSNRWMVFLCLSRITMSGFWTVTQSSGGLAGHCRL